MADRALPRDPCRGSHRGRAAKVATKEGLDAVAFMARRAGLDVRVSPSKVVTSAIVAVVKVGKVGQVESPWAVPDALADRL